MELAVANVAYWCTKTLDNTSCGWARGSSFCHFASTCNDLLYWSLVEDSQEPSMTALQDWLGSCFSISLYAASHCGKLSCFCGSASVCSTVCWANSCPLPWPIGTCATVPGEGFGCSHRRHCHDQWRLPQSSQSPGGGLSVLHLLPAEDT